MRGCDALDNIRFNYQFKIFTISNIKMLNNKSFYRILRLLSSDINLNQDLKLISNHWIKMNGMFSNQRDST